MRSCLQGLEPGNRKRLINNRRRCAWRVVGTLQRFASQDGGREGGKNGWLKGTGWVMPFTPPPHPVQASHLPGPGENPSPSASHTCPYDYYFPRGGEEAPRLARVRQTALSEAHSLRTGHPSKGRGPGLRENQAAHPGRGSAKASGCEGLGRGGAWGSS